MILTSLIHWKYKHILKPIFFLRDPEAVHDGMTSVGVLLGKFAGTRWLTRLFFDYKNKALEQTILGIHFQNPVGLSAGFDKNARLSDIMPDVGFGFEEVGSITGEPCKGNPKKRLWRLPKSEALVINYGLVNDGAERICAKLRKKKFRIPIGINMAKTNNQVCAIDEKGIEDHAKSLKEAGDIGDYHTLNISCPNSFGGQSFHRPEALDMLLAHLHQNAWAKPVFLKLSPDITKESLKAIIEVGKKHGIHGLIISNLTKQYDLSTIDQEEFKKRGIEAGGISGKPTKELSNTLIAEAYRLAGNDLVIIGCGGIFSAEDAYKKIRSGASLVQLITGMIYEGPQLIGEINRGLVELLKKDGFTSISQAIGADVIRES